MNKHIGKILRAFALTIVMGCAGYITPDGGFLFVQTAPPVTRVEVRGSPPSRTHVWVDGHWAWQGNAYVWQPGEWRVVQTGARRWEPGHWGHNRSGYFWVEGRWR